VSEGNEKLGVLNPTPTFELSDVHEPRVIMLKSIENNFFSIKELL
jgi:hypothetical protein